jgi:type II secretory pathway pseudopilin PulG
MTPRQVTPPFSRFFPAARQPDSPPTKLSDALWKRAYTLLEIVISSALFSMFLAAILLVFRSGHQAGNQSMWLQKTAQEQRNAIQQINSVVRRSSYPSTIVFPGKILENTRNEFKVHLSGRGTLCATESAQPAGDGIDKPGTLFLRVTESNSEKVNFAETSPASLTYHIYSLTNTGKILYHRYSESVISGSPTYIKSIARTQIPPEEAALTSHSQLVSDVESVHIEPRGSSSSEPAFQLTITCKNPKGNTRRSESTICTPNVEVMVRPYAQDW